MGIYDRDYMRRRESPSISLGRLLAIAAAIAVALGGAIYLSQGREQRSSHRSAASSESIPAQPINVNTATEEQLASIPHIPSGVRRAIIDHRPYSTPEDLMRVPGIKKRRLEQIRPYITVK